VKLISQLSAKHNSSSNGIAVGRTDGGSHLSSAFLGRAQERGQTAQHTNVDFNAWAERAALSTADLSNFYPHSFQFIAR
jgi:hypothetical protein